MADNDIGYRAKFLPAYDDRWNKYYAKSNPIYYTNHINNDAGQWFGNNRSHLGVSGISLDIDSLKRSLGANSCRKGEYEIWKIYIGSEMPGHPDWFPPEKVEQ